MTDATEAGARAIKKLATDSIIDGPGIPRPSYSEISKACIEAAIASGALVPASAVAEMRERCAQAGWKAAYDSGQIRRHTDTPDEVANAIRQLDIAPASGDYVVGWRTMDSAPKDMTEIIVLCGPKDVRLGWYFAPSSTTFGWLDQRQRPINPTAWMPLPLHAASRTGGGE